MARTKISEFSATPGNNTEIDGINIAEGCAPSGINDAIRELMSQLKDFQAGTAGDSFNGPVGTTTAAAGAFTTLSASSTVSGTGFSNYLASPPAIGGTAAAAGSFTTLSASSTVTLSGGTANGVLYLNGSKVATSGSALTWDGTTLTATNASAGNYYSSAAAFRIGYSASYPYIDLYGSAGNIIAFGIAASEVARLTSTGLGIGTSAPTTKLDVNGDARIGGTSVSQSLLTVGGGSTSAAVNLRGATGSAYAWQISSNAFVGSALEFTRSTAVGGTTFSTPSMLLDSSGNLGLGVTPSRLIDAQKDQNAATQFRIRNDNNGTASQSSVSASYGDFAQYITMGQYSPSFTTSGLRAANSSGVFTSGNTNGLRVYTIDSTPLIFGTADTERARIDSSGNLLVGTTTQSGKVTISYAYPQTGIALTTDSTSTQSALSFSNPNGTVGTINTSGSATSYNTSSDYRLKDNPQPLTGSGAFIDALQPKTWNWKADGSKGVGFIAHEVQEVSPSSVVGEKDGERMQAMEYGSAEFIANIIAELQSLRKRVAQLEGK